MVESLLTSLLAAPTKKPTSAFCFMPQTSSHMTSLHRSVWHNPHYAVYYIHSRVCSCLSTKVMSISSLSADTIAAVLTCQDGRAETVCRPWLKNTWPVNWRLMSLSHIHYRWIKSMTPSIWCIMDKGLHLLVYFLSSQPYTRNFAVIIEACLFVLNTNKNTNTWCWHHHSVIVRVHWVYLMTVEQLHLLKAITWLDDLLVFVASALLWHFRKISNRRRATAVIVFLFQLFHTWYLPLHSYQTVFCSCFKHLFL